MNWRKCIILGFVVPVLGASQATGTDLDTIGMTALRGRDSTLTGDGVTVAMAEATVTANATVYQPNPSFVSQSAAKFTFFDNSSPYPNGNATFNPSFESWHANSVGGNYFGSNGVAPGVAAIKVFEANYFLNSIVNASVSASISLVNQSFVTGNQTSGIDQIYDNYSDRYKVLFVNGVNNGNTTAPPSPATMYNGIAVGLANGGSSTGPTTTDGRSKPDIVAPSFATSFATPYVSGSAAILIQAGTRGDAGNGTATTAVDPRTLKALLLNGAVKPSGWTRNGTEPLDRTYGAGVLNINRSHLQLSGGKHAPTISSNSTAGGAHFPPSGVTGNVTSLVGWNNTSITNSRVSGSFADRTDNYFFDLPNSLSGAFHATCTLVWHRQNGQSAINNLDFFLYRASDNALVASGNSTVDNVEHLYLANLPAGRYVLQVFKPASGALKNILQNVIPEAYAVAFAFEPVPVPMAPASFTATPASTSQINLSWTDSSGDETGFRISRSLSSNSGFSEIATTGANATTYSDAGLEPGTTYFYRISAFSLAGDSIAVSANATTVALPPSSPANLSAVVLSSSQIQLSWTDISENESGFRILRSLSNDTGFSQIGTVGVNGTAYLDSTVQAGTTYFYRVSAYSQAGDSAPSTTSATSFTALESWRNAHFATPAAEGGAADSIDADSDTLPNLVEYALGTDPLQRTDVTSLLVPSVEASGGDNYLTLTLRRLGIQPGVTYSIESSSDLLTWENSVTVLSNTETELKVRDSVPIGTASKRFLRLRITSP